MFTFNKNQNYRRRGWLEYSIKTRSIYYNTKLKFDPQKLKKIMFGKFISVSYIHTFSGEKLLILPSNIGIPFRSVSCYLISYMRGKLIKITYKAPNVN